MCLLSQRQRINGSSFVFSAAMPALLAVSASEGLNILRNTPSVFSTLQDNIRAARSILDKLDGITVPSHSTSPIIHIRIRSSSSVSEPLPSTVSKLSNPTSINPRNPQKFDYIGEERLLQEVVEECLAQGVLVTRAKRLRGQELIETKPSIRLAITSALTRKETEKAAGVLKAALAKVLAKR
jgi:serine palmitoyltransferase